MEVGEIAGPAVQQDERNCCRVRRALMHEVEIDVATVHLEVLEGVEILLLQAMHLLPSIRQDSVQHTFCDQRASCRVLQDRDI